MDLQPGKMNFSTYYMYDYYLSDNYSNLITPSPDHFIPSPVPEHIKIIFTVVYSIIMLFALSGNTLVIFVILGNKSLRNVTNMFLISLAISDILISGFNIPLGLLYNFNAEWTHGEILCKFVSFATSVNVIASIMTLTAVALERYSINIFLWLFSLVDICQTKLYIYIVIPYWSNMLYDQTLFSVYFSLLNDEVFFWTRPYLYIFSRMV